MNFKQDKDYVLRTIPLPSRDNDPPSFLSRLPNWAGIPILYGVGLACIGYNEFFLSSLWKLSPWHLFWIFDLTIFGSPWNHLQVSCFLANSNNLYLNNIIEKDLLW